MSNLGQTLLIPAKGNDASAASFWATDSTYNRRIVVTATNTQSIALHDHLIDITVPASANIDATSLRAIEITSLGSVDKAYDWRYSGDVNHFWWLPVSISGTTVTLKTLGRWAASETRYFALYWDSNAALPAFNYNHMDGIVQTWSYVVGGTLTVGDVYKLVIGGATPATYSYTAIGGDTTTTIAQALKALVSSSIATISGAAATLTITQVAKTDGNFSVASTGSTLATGTITITRPSFFGMGRVGPDTTTYSATAYLLGYPANNPVSAALTRPGFGRATNHVAGRLMSYSVNGVGTQTPNYATNTTITNDGPKVRISGSLNWTRTEWTSTYSAVHSQRMYSGRSSATYPDDGSTNVMKFADVVRLTLTYTCANGYAPTTVANNATTLGAHEMLALAATANVFTSNTTENGFASPQTSGAQSQNAIPNFYAPLNTGAITAYTSTDAATLTALPVTGASATIIGAHGNSMGSAICIESVTFANFTADPEAKWTTQGNSFGVLHLRNLSSGTNIPAGATITIVATVISGYTNSATTAGNNLLPDEVVTMMRGILGTQPTITVGNVERYSSAGLTATMSLAGSRAVDGIKWFQDNAASITNTSGNTGYQYQVKTSTVSTPDDDDGNYGDAFKLAGLCLRYLRTHDSALITLIETQVSYILLLESTIVAERGSWWSGSAPYWMWPSASNSGSTYTTEGGVNGGDQDPGIVGAPTTITYTRGQVRAKTSTDQMHIVAGGLYHYLYLLRNESAITANTTLVTNAKSYVSRLATFEAAHIAADSRICGNLDKIVNSLTPLRANGITDTEYNDGAGTALANPFYGLDSAENFYGWQINNGDAKLINPNSNITMDDFYRATFAPASTVAGTLRYLRGQAGDFVASDLYHHDVTFGTASWNTGYTTSVFPSYPRGWMVRAAVTSNVYKYTNGRTGDDHFILLSAAGHRDAIGGKSAQRLAGMCLAYLLGGAYDVSVENNGASSLRSVALADEIDSLANVLATYGIEPTTKAQRMSVAGWLGEPSTLYDPQRADSAFTGYWMYALELWYLVKAGASYSSYYPIGTW